MLEHAFKIRRYGGGYAIRVLILLYSAIIIVWVFVEIMLRIN